MPLVRIIGMDAARCDQAERLSPVQTAAVRCEPAKKERVRTKGRLGFLASALLRASKARYVALWKVMPLMLWTSRCSQLPKWMLSFGIVVSGPLNTDGSFMSFQRKVFRKVPLKVSYLKSDFHHVMAAGLKQSTQCEEPGQHQPS